MLLCLIILILPSLFRFQSELNRIFVDRDQGLATITASSKANSHLPPNETNSNHTSSQGQEQSRIVVSLKTMPSRIKYIEPTLSSLLVDQTMPIHKLYLVLPKTKWIRTSHPGDDPAIHYDLHDFLTNLTKHDKRLTILHPDYDYGPVDKILYALQEEERNPATKLIYLDDDVLYHTDLVKTLVTKAKEYPNSAVALSGCKLRSHFRQISHQFPRQNFDRHPNLYFLLSGSESVTRDETVDVVQGFTGVLVRPFFFDVTEFANLVRNDVTRFHDVWKADDYIISAYLEHRSISKTVVASEVLSVVHKPAATKNNLGKGMHRQTMQAAHVLQSRLGIWSQYDFVDYLSLDPYWRDLMDCEAGLGCQIAQVQATKGEKITRRSATKLLDDYLLPL